MTDHDLHLLTGAYAADALDDLERRAFLAHLDDCPSCRQEVDGLLATTARLAGAASSPTPVGLRDRVLAEVASTRQDSPGAGAPQPSVAWFRRPLGIAASVLLVLAMGLGAFAVSEKGRADRAERLASRITAVATDPDRTQASRPISSGGAGTLVTANGQAIFRADGLAPLPADRTYQLWVIDAGGPHSAGVLGRGGNGTVQRYLAEVARSDRIGLTVEPSGGSASPTTDPVVVLAVSG